MYKVYFCNSMYLESFGLATAAKHCRKALLRSTAAKLCAAKHCHEALLQCIAVILSLVLQEYLESATKLETGLATRFGNFKFFFKAEFCNSI